MLRSRGCVNRQLLQWIHCSHKIEQKTMQWTWLIVWHPILPWQCDSDTQSTLQNIWQCLTVQAMGPRPGFCPLRSRHFTHHQISSTSYDGHAVIINGISNNAQSLFRTGSGEEYLIQLKWQGNNPKNVSDLMLLLLTNVPIIVMT